MKINVYDNWIDFPEGRERPFKTVGVPMLCFNTKKHSAVKILARLSKMAKRSSKHEGKSLESRYLVVLLEKDYENSLSGTPEQICKFVKDCLVDEGLMSNIWGKRK